MMNTKRLYFFSLLTSTLVGKPWSKLSACITYQYVYIHRVVQNSIFFSPAPTVRSCRRHFHAFNASRIHGSSVVADRRRARRGFVTRPGCAPAHQPSRPPPLRPKPRTRGRSTTHPPPLGGPRPPGPTASATPPDKHARACVCRPLLAVGRLQVSLPPCQLGGRWAPLAPRPLAHVSGPAAGGPACGGPQARRG